MADSPDLFPPTPDPPPAEGGSSPVSPAPVTPAPVSQPRSRSGLGAGLHSLWTLVVRLIILGAGVSLGWLAGMLVAQAFPARNPEPPLTEVALRYSSQTLRKLQQLPQWWRGAEPPPPADNLAATTPPDSPAETAGAGSTAVEPPPLSEDDRDRITEDLTSLRQDLVSLNAQLEAIETTLGEPPTGTVEDRLRRIDQRLNVAGGAAEPPEAPAATEAETSAPGSAAAATYQEPRFSLVSDRVVLPSALLFESGSSTLTAPGQQLLNAIVPDLRRYGVATLLVGSHTDSTTGPELASQLTLQQSLAVQQYMTPQLEGSGSRWVAVGYGNSRPLTTGADPVDRQRNQRVEIGIVPGR